MKNFRTYNLALDFYGKAKELKLREPMKNQFERALLSIPLNLAEGSAKQTAKDRRKYYRIALGSMREVQTIIKLVNHAPLEQQADRLAAHIYKLCTRT